jgi:hypothetical protein
MRVHADYTPFRLLEHADANILCFINLRTFHTKIIIRKESLSQTVLMYDTKKWSLMNIKCVIRYDRIHE